MDVGNLSLRRKIRLWPRNRKTIIDQINQEAGFFITSHRFSGEGFKVV